MVKKAATRKIKKKALRKGKLAVVVSLFNPEVCQSLLKSCLKTLAAHGFAKTVVDVFEVPGAFEIPLVAKKLAKSRRYLGVVALGCVIRGDTPHFEFVSLAATMGCLQASLETERPVAFGVITVNNSKQAKARSRDDDFNKGKEAALALLDTLETLERV